MKYAILNAGAEDYDSIIATQETLWNQQPWHWVYKPRISLDWTQSFITVMQDIVSAALLESFDTDAEALTYMNAHSAEWNED